MPLILSGFALICWLALLLVPWRPWLNGEVVKSEQELSDDLSDVSVIIPSRNEASVINDTLQALKNQGEGLKIIVVDDRSTDGTGDAVKMVSGIDVELVNGEPLPLGWSGKLWAQEQGLRLVRTPMTLLLDADINLSPGLISALINLKTRENVQFVSVMATLKMKNFWEIMLNPAFIYFFKLLYPFRLANSANKRFASAAGGCILFLLLQQADVFYWIPISSLILAAW